MAKSRRDDDLGLDLDERPAPSAAPSTAPAPLAGQRPRQDNRPTCPRHGVQMVSYATNPMFTYYRCPEEHCSERDKQVRPVGPFVDLYGHGKSAREKDEG